MLTLAIVGCDGAGKTTAVSVLARRLGPTCTVKQIDKWDVLDHGMYPEYRFLKQDLPTLRRCVSDMPEVTRTLFLFWLLHGTLTRRAADGAEIILLDGYWPKHAASEIIHTGHRELVETLVGLLPRPDLTLFLDVDPQIAYGRRTADRATPLVPYECGLDRSCSEGSFLRHQHATREILLEWCITQGWTRIDANHEPDAVSESVLSAVATLLAKPAQARV